MKSQLRNRLRSRRGSAFIEFALAATVLIPIFLGTFQFGYGFYVYNLMSSQVRAGARYASLRTYRCGNASSMTAFTTAVKNVVRFGNPTGTGTVIEPGLQDSEVRRSASCTIPAARSRARSCRRRCDAHAELRCGKGGELHSGRRDHHVQF